MNVKRRIRRACWMVGVSALIVGSGLQFGSASAQDAGKSNRVGTAKVSDFQIIQLKNCPAEEMANTLLRAFNLTDSSAIRIVADARTNTILVSAPEADLAKVKDLVMKLDVLAQEDGSDATETLVITLKYTRAAEAEKLLQQVLAPRTARGSVPLNIGVDERKNAVVIVAPKRTGAEIRAIMERIDTPGPGLLTGSPPSSLERHLKMIQLRSIEPDKALEDALHLVIGSGGNFVLDRQRKVVIATADASTLAATDAFIAALEAKSVPPANDVQLRLVWLVNGLPRDNAPPVPDDLKEVLPGLAKMGIDKPRLAAQTLVSFMPGATFEANGVAQLDAACQFAVRGFFSDKKDGSALQISVNASTMRGNSTVNICKLETAITAPPGHLVVLGMTPTDTMTSVFVVQVLRPDAKKPSTAK